MKTLDTTIGAVTTLEKATQTESQIQQLERCIESMRIVATLDSDIDVKAMFRKKIKDFRDQIRALQAS